MAWGNYLLPEKSGRFEPGKEKCVVWRFRKRLGKKIRCQVGNKAREDTREPTECK